MAAPDRLAQLTQWMDAMKPGADRAPAAADAANRGLFAGATAALADDMPVVADAVLGGDMEADMLARSRELKALIDRGETAAALQHFRNSPADGCTSIIDLARIKAAYNPAQTGVGDSLERFRRFATAIVDAPVFVKRALDVRPLRWTAARWEHSVRQVLGQFPGIDAADARRIRASLERLARAAAGRVGPAQSGAVYVQNVLRGVNGDFEVYLYYAAASFRLIQQKKHAPEFVSELRLARAHLTFIGASWPEYAEAVWQRHVCAVVDWLEANTSPPGTDAAELCFDR